MADFLEAINNAVWGVPLLIMILGCGLYYTLRTKGIQFCLLVPSVKHLLNNLGKNRESQGCSTFRALCTALGATVGTGNLAGVAGAIALGGPGAIFWMWISGFLGMVIKFCEALLSVRFREKTDKGEYRGGPMYAIRNGMGRKWNWMAKVYCILGLVAAFGVGNAVQINTVVSGFREAMASGGVYLAPGFNLFIGLGASLLIWMLFRRRETGIGKASEILIPVATTVYLLLGCFTLACHYTRILPAIQSIIVGAFSPKAVTGGMVGSGFICLRTGISRGVFTNEAGMGTAGIAHGAANVRDPIEQGMMGIVEVFLDTIVICTITALAILVSGIPIPYGTDSGISLTIQAFNSVCGGWAGYLICGLVGLFAFATVLGWGLYGGQCAMYLFGEKSWGCFLAAEILVAFFACVGSARSVWLISDIFNGLMAVPNLICMFCLCPYVLSEVSRSRRKRTAPLC